MYHDNIASHSIRQVALTDIDVRPGPYCMSFGFDVDQLMQSIKRVGLVNSPLIIRNGLENFNIITGYRRIHASKSLGWKTIPCRILSENEMPPLNCLLLGLYDNLCTRELNNVEKGMILSRLSSMIQRNEILEYYMPLLELPSHGPTLDLYLRLDHELDEKSRESISKGHLSLYAAKLFLEIDNDARTSVLQLILNLKFNINQQRQLVDNIIMLSNNSKRSIVDILEEKTLKNIYCDTRMNNPQKVNAILMTLRSRVFPRLIEAEETFKKTTSDLDLPEGVRISHPPFFESPNYRLEVLFKNGKDLEAKIERLYQTKGFSSLRDPWGRIPDA